jgi:hypothetical protein
MVKDRSWHTFPPAEMFGMEERRERLLEYANDGQYDFLLRRSGAKRIGEWDDELVLVNEWLPPGRSALGARVPYPDEEEDDDDGMEGYDDRMEEDDEMVEQHTVGEHWKICE